MGVLSLSKNNTQKVCQKRMQTIIAKITDTFHIVLSILDAMKEKDRQQGHSRVLKILIQETCEVPSMSV